MLVSSVMVTKLCQKRKQHARNSGESVPHLWFGLFSLVEIGAFGISVARRVLMTGIPAVFLLSMSVHGDIPGFRQWCKHTEFRGKR